MKIEKTLSYIGIAWIAFTVLKSIGNGIANAVELEKINWGGIDFIGSGARITIRLKLKNNNSTPLNLNRLTGTVFFNGSALFPINVTTPVLVPAGGEAEIPISANVNFSQLTTNIVSIIQSGNFIPNLKAKGQLVSNGFLIDFEKNILSIG